MQMFLSCRYGKIKNRINNLLKFFYKQIYSGFDVLTALLDSNFNENRDLNLVCLDSILDILKLEVFFLIFVKNLIL